VFVPKLRHVAIGRHRIKWLRQIRPLERPKTATLLWAIDKASRYSVPTRCRSAHQSAPVIRCHTKPLRLYFRLRIAVIAAPCLSKSRTRTGHIRSAHHGPGNHLRSTSPDSSHHQRHGAHQKLHRGDRACPTLTLVTSDVAFCAGRRRSGARIARRLSAMNSACAVVCPAAAEPVQPDRRSS